MPTTPAINTTGTDLLVLTFEDEELTPERMNKLIAEGWTLLPQESEQIWYKPPERQTHGNAG